MRFEAGQENSQRECYNVTFRSEAYLRHWEGSARGWSKRGGVVADPATGRQKGENQPVERFSGALGEQRLPPVGADNAQHPAEIIAERHQAPFGAHLVKPAHQKVAVSGTAFERAKGV